MDKILVIGIAGGSGSGKTTLKDSLTEDFGDGIAVLSHDNYYRAHNDLPFEQRSKLNYDHPDAFETDLMISHLQQLRQGKTIQCPVYDFTIHNRTSETITVEPKNVIIVEGILIFENKALCDLMDIKIFVDTNDDIRLIRRIRRDVSERGRSLESVLNQYLETVKPMHEQFVEPSKKNADVVVLGGGRNLVALNMITSQIQRHLDCSKDATTEK